MWRRRRNLLKFYYKEFHVIKINQTFKVERNPLMVEIHAVGPKGGKIEWTVTFGVDNAIRHGYCYLPHSGFQPEYLIPMEIKDAARKEFFHGANTVNAHHPTSSCPAQGDSVDAGLLPEQTGDVRLGGSGSGESVHGDG
jgi:hypothetical protein